MTEWIQPLELETIIINIFSGSPEYFSAIALFFIAGMAAYFKMRVLPMFIMIGLFFLMFSTYIGANFLILFSIIGGLMIGYSMSRIFN